MLTLKHVFRPACLLTLGPRSILAMLLSASIVVATNYGLVAPDVALRLHLVSGGVLLVLCLCWWLEGSVVVKPNQVILQGWTKVVDGWGRKRVVPIRESVPRCEWRSLTVTGQFFATVIWCHDGKVVVFERLSRPDLLRKLLAAPEAQFDSMPSLRPLPLALVALARALKLAIGKGIAEVARWVPPARTHLDAAAR